MPRRARTLNHHYCFHVINRGACKAPLFERSKDYRDFLRILREGLQRYPATVMAYCVMSNHWHLVLGPVGTKRLSQLMHWVTTTHAVRLQRRRKTVGLGPVYQGRFKSRAIESSGQLLRTIRYVERNAVAANLVLRAEHWPWSSLADRQRSKPELPLAGTPFLTSQAWIDHVNVPHFLLDEDPRSVPDLPKSVEARPVPLRDFAEDPRAGQGSKKRGGVRGRRGDDKADAHIERAKHFRLVKTARAPEPLEQRRHRPAATVE